MNATLEISDEHNTGVAMNCFHIHFCRFVNAGARTVYVHVSSGTIDVVTLSLLF